MSKRVLFVLHNHPALSPGGSEAYTMELYRALQHSEQFEPMVLARADPGAASGFTTHAETPFTSLEADPDQILAVLPEDRYDKFFMRGADNGEFARHFVELLRHHRPDVVHFQHTLFLGAELITAVRRTLPEAAIVFTLHEYLPICHHYGQLVRTMGGLCTMASPRRCHQCFPQHSPQEFFLRKQLIQSHFDQVDLFIAPSRFLLERYVEWGVPRTRIRYEQHGATPARHFESPARSPRNRFAFFGVLTPFKGIDVLLRAMATLGPDFDGSLQIHGASYAEQPEAMRRQLEALFEQTHATVTHAGPYDHATLPRLMAETEWVVVPSIWWENSPLVIQEAFMHGRPVICSDVGGMAEKVTHRVDGLLFPVQNQRRWPRRFELAAETRRLVGAPRGRDRARPHDRGPRDRLESIYRRLL